MSYISSVTTNITTDIQPAVESAVSVPKTQDPYTNSALKRFTLGTVTAIGSQMVAELTELATQPFLKDQNPCVFWHTMADNIKNRLPHLDEKRIYKYVAIGSAVNGGIGEELIFRYLIQDVLLKRGLGKAIKIISPKHASFMDSSAGKTIRVVTTAALFAASHLVGTKNEDGFILQATCAFIGGIYLGTIKESRLGLIGSIGSHMMHNVLGMSYGYLKCARV